MTNEVAISSRAELWKSPAMGPIDVDFGALGPAPHSWLECERCNRYFYHAWACSLTDQEAEFLPVWPNVPDNAIRRSMNHKMDQKIFEFASLVGTPFINYCQVYQRRIDDWRKDPDGPRLYRRYGEALAHGAEVEQSPPYEGPKAVLQEPHAFQFREKACAEWGLMRERIKSYRVENPHVKTIGGLWPFIKSEVLAGSKTFPVLQSRLSHLEQFLTDSASNLEEVLRWQARQFVKEWMSYGTGRDAVSLGHDVGKMGKALKAKV